MFRRLIGVGIAASVLLCAACGAQSTEESQTTTTVTDTRPTASYSDVEIQQAPDLSTATVVTLDDHGCTVEGEGAVANGSTVTVSRGGTYAVRGALSDGQLRVDAKGETVTLVFDGVDIHCDTSAPLYILKAETVMLHLAADSENRLSDSETFAFEDTEAEEPSATLFSKADLVINGNGALTVDAVFRDGIVSRDTLKIAGGTLTVNAADDGIMGRDSVYVGGGDILINAEGDGIKSTNDTDDSCGCITVENGDITIKSGADGIQAVSTLTVTGGKLAITANGGHQNGSPNKGQDFGFGWREDSASTADSTGKGLKAGSLLSINGGNITVDAADDALHSNDTVTVEGGVITASTGDDGVHADKTLTISGGKLTVVHSFEGLEAAAITLENGDVSVTATDDGINASSGSTEAEGDRGFMGGDPFAADDSFFTINGGVLRVDAEGDGLDSNGNAEMNGGTVYVCGPSNGGNGTLDFAANFTIRGGVLIAVGSMGMAQTPTANTQNAVVWNGCSLNSGSVFRVTDADGAVVAELTSSRAATWAYVTAPTMQTGERYTLSCEDTTQTVTLTAGLNTIGNSSGDFGRPGRPGTPPDGGRPGGWW